MLLHIAGLLNREEIARCRKALEAASWVDGAVTAGTQSARAKSNLQLPEAAPEAQALGELVLDALGRNPTFVTAALPAKVFPPLFNRYDAGMKFDAHVDNAIRRLQGSAAYIRTDISATLFLSEPGEYEGGELVVQDTYGEHAVKLAAGDLVIYPATSLHRVEPIRQGSRLACFFWIESMVKEAAKRVHLYELDLAIRQVRADLSDDHPAARSLTAGYHNLLRLWAET